MSLIQEALKRRQDEQGGALSTPTSSQLFALPPVAAAPVRPEGKRVVLVRGVCYSVLFLGACAGMFSLYRSYAVKEPAVIVTQVPVDASAVPVSQPAAPVLPVPQETVAPAVAEPVEPALVSPETLAAEPQPEAVPEPIAAPLDPDAPPVITVIGALARPEQDNSSAVINGRLVDVGQSIEGVRLLHVKQSGVVIRYQGEDQFVRVGQSAVWE